MRQRQSLCLAPRNLDEGFGNFFSRHIFFSLTASITPMAIEKWAMQSAASAPAIKPPAGFPLHVDRTGKVDLGEQIFSFFIHHEAFIAVIFSRLPFDSAFLKGSIWASPASWNQERLENRVPGFSPSLPACSLHVLTQYAICRHGAGFLQTGFV